MTHKNHSKYFKIWYIVAEIAFILLAIILGFVFKTSDSNLLYSEEHFNWGLAISIWVSSVIPISVLYAVYAHLENQEIQIDIMYQTYHEICKQNTPSKVIRTSSNTSTTSTTSSNANWTCKKCGHINKLNSMQCADCGTYR